MFCLMKPGALLAVGMVATLLLLINAPMPTMARDEPQGKNISEMMLASNLSMSTTDNGTAASLEIKEIKELFLEEVTPEMSTMAEDTSTAGEVFKDVYTETDLPSYYAGAENLSSASTGVPTFAAAQLELQNAPSTEDPQNNADPGMDSNDDHPLGAGDVDSLALGVAVKTTSKAKLNGTTRGKKSTTKHHGSTHSVHSSTFASMKTVSCDKLNDNRCGKMPLNSKCDVEKKECGCTLGSVLLNGKECKKITCKADKDCHVAGVDFMKCSKSECVCSGLTKLDDTGFVCKMQTWFTILMVVILLLVIFGCGYWILKCCCCAASKPAASSAKSSSY